MAVRNLFRNAARSKYVRQKIGLTIKKIALASRKGTTKSRGLFFASLQKAIKSARSDRKMRRILRVSHHRLRWIQKHMNFARAAVSFLVGDPSVKMLYKIKSGGYNP